MFRYALPTAEFVISSDATVQMISRIPFDFSESKNSWNDFDKCCWSVPIIIFR